MGTSTLQVSIKRLLSTDRRSEMIYGPVDIVNSQNSATVKKQMPQQFYIINTRKISRQWTLDCQAAEDCSFISAS